MAEKTNLSEGTGNNLQDVAEVVNKNTSTLARQLNDWLDGFSWMPDWLVHWASVFLLLIGLSAISWLLFVVVRPVILRVIKKAALRTNTSFDDHLFGHGMFRWITHMFPALLIYIVAPGLFESSPNLEKGLRLVSSLYLLAAGYMSIDSFLNAAYAYFKTTVAGRRLNLSTFVQVIKLLIALVTIVIGIAIIFGKSPVALIGGIGVFASILMLVFKDVILGFVGGVQLTSNKMLSVGDWLEMPSHNADGDVEQIGLTTVKIRNWDKTITTIPTYDLISNSFKNWRGMAESDGRRIKRSLLIDTNSIRLCDEEMLARFANIEHIAEYLEEKQNDIAKWNTEKNVSVKKSEVNGRQLTNVGTFRAYMVAYLRSHPDINKKMTLLVRQLASNGHGLPIEIYCFSAIKEWEAYENIQADIFDHFFAIATEFDLHLYQSPTGMDFREGIASATTGA